MLTFQKKEIRWAGYMYLVITWPLVLCRLIVYFILAAGVVAFGIRLWQNYSRFQLHIIADLQVHGTDD